MIPIWFTIWMIASFTWLFYESDWMRIRLLIGETYISEPLPNYEAIPESHFLPPDNPKSIYYKPPMDYCWMCHKNAPVSHYQQETFTIGYPNLRQAFDYTVCEDCHTKIEKASNGNHHKPKYPSYAGFNFGLYNFTERQIEPLCGWDWLSKAQQNGHRYEKQTMTISYDGKEIGKFDTYTKAGEVKTLVKEIRSQHPETYCKYGKSKTFLGSDLTQEQITAMIGGE